MISKDCTITIDKGNASVDEDVYLYKNDMNIQILFTIVNNKYRYTKNTAIDNIIANNKASYAQVKFKKGDIEIDFEEQETKDGAVVLLIKKELIDEDTELGDYSIQIRLFDENKTSVITLPPVENCIHIQRPLFEKAGEDTNIVDQALTDMAVVTYAEPISATNSDGTYNKKTWVAKEKITTAELNRMEDGIAYNNTQFKDIAKENSILYSKIDEILEHLGLKGKVTYTGRWFTKNIDGDNCMCTINSGSELYFKVKNATKITIETKDIGTVTTDYKPYIRCRIGNSDTRVQLINSTTEIPVSNKNENNVRITISAIRYNGKKWSAEEGFAIKNISTDGTILTDDVSSKNQILFLGDSITEGQLMTAGNFSGLNSDKAFPHLVTDSFTDYICIQNGFGGTGMLVGGNAGMPVAMQCLTNISRDRVATYDYDKIKLIVINYGTNDVGKNDTVGFKTAYKTYIEYIKSKFTNAKIIIIRPCTKVVYEQQITEIAEEENVYLCEVSGSVSKTDSVHPNEAGHQVIANSLIQFIQDKKILTSNPDVPYSYSITNNLSNATNSNPNTSIARNESYTATINPDSDYELGSITVTMGGVDITHSVVNENSINITSVTGNIIITVTTVESYETVKQKIENAGGYYRNFSKESSTDSTITLNGAILDSSEGVLKLPSSYTFKSDGVVFNKDFINGTLELGISSGELFCLCLAYADAQNKFMFYNDGNKISYAELINNKLQTSTNVVHFPSADSENYTVKVVKNNKNVTLKALNSSKTELCGVDTTISDTLTGNKFALCTTANCELKLKYIKLTTE